MLLSVRNLCVDFHGEDGPFRAVDGVSFDLADGERLAIMGESGCGKSSVALALMRLLEGGGVHVSADHLALDGRSLLTLDARAIRSVRGGEIAMIFQDATTALHPLIPVGAQVVEMIRAHRRLSRSAARTLALSLFQRVGIAAPERRLAAYPHELSGGMCQRVMIAMAIACRPRMLLADEPTTALDVTVQAQIMDLLLDVSAESGMAVILISHDLGVIAGAADRVAVMYAGAIVEIGPTETIYALPAHPYTRALLDTAPRVDIGVGEPLPVIPGNVAGAHALVGCQFAPRCDVAVDRCHSARPPSRRIGDRHEVACWVTTDTAGADAR
ncbi:ABC transporter ATP-binding protein [Gluconacetobacter aggeris]|uniref:ABC transporter ATP-binding protein n=1 Tax=Gluconacetobacter aggeris TaxID=1286186 RepID=A0A7W4IVF7_9PROT|nr:ABC transporter ATP-binding protein [Gluconacetobacter aggeris]MBB2169732.1 ABC transporter ATP-binding protein [Gluconacetobacter aggeris]